MIKAEIGSVAMSIEELQQSARRMIAEGKSREQIAGFCYEHGSTLSAATSFLRPKKLSLVQDALRYAAFDWKMMPCKGKVPVCGKGWQHKATSDPKAVKQLFKTSHDSLGVQLGPASGIIDIECDDDESEHTLHELFDGNIPDAPTFKSTRGLHRIFRYTDALPCPDKAVVKILNLEFRTGRGKGCQTVLPPSHGRSWVVKPTDCEPAEIPDWVIDRITERLRKAGEHAPSANQLTDYYTDPDRRTRRAKAWLAKAVPAVSGQHGHDRTYYVANQLVSFGLSRDEALLLIREWNQYCLPPWSDAELIHKIDDAIGANPPPKEDRQRQPASAGGCRGGLDQNSTTEDQHIDSESAEVQTDALRRSHEVGSLSRVSNFITTSGGEGDPVNVPLSMGEINEVTNRLADGWPRRVSDQLFVHDKEQRAVFWLRDSDALFSYLGHTTGEPPNILSRSGFHSKKEIFSHLQRAATNCAAVESLPHVPTIDGHYYACDTPESGNGLALRELVNQYAPESESDRDLIAAMFVTPFWGGRGGTRPAFVITSDAGRGAGKSKLAEHVAMLAGGAIDISGNEDVQTLKTRLLSPEAATKRIVLFDNIKTSRLSWAELEALITAPTISGKRLYVGEGQRPNNLTYILTMNGVSLSQDMAQRSIVIKIRKPAYSGDWDQKTKRFIEDNREAIISDICGFLRSTPSDLSRFTRWGDWERCVLSRLPNPNVVQEIVAQRRAGADADNEESETIEDFFADRLSRFGYDTRADRVFISSATACRWLAWALNEKFTTLKSSRMLNQRIEDGSFRNLISCRSRTHGRGFEFLGANATGQTYLQLDLEDQIRSKGDYQVSS